MATEHYIVIIAVRLKKSLGSKLRVLISGGCLGILNVAATYMTSKF